MGRKKLKGRFKLTLVAHYIYEYQREQLTVATRNGPDNKSVLMRKALDLYFKKNPHLVEAAQTLAV